ncbi:hypothetical protein [Vermiculatibacterium agrestimuris]|uniref:hypothetical protein n=1 Tax=Vermiculatibacterium agrestimuris TaxID=2941519 RepID=UPI00203ECA08|nr:hypothetical protein [Vermiculatibacterium agrestimuris]
MSAVREWLLGVTAAALAVALAQALTPEGAVKKVGRLVGGMVLLLAVAKPLLSLEPGTLAVTAGAWEQEAAARTGEDVMKTLIEEKTSAYIVDKGGALGMECTAQTQAEDDGSGWTVPWQVTVRGTWNESQRQALSDLIARELDIPPERQSFQKEGT